MEGIRTELRDNASGPGTFASSWHCATLHRVTSRHRTERTFRRESISSGAIVAGPSEIRQELER